MSKEWELLAGRLEGCLMGVSGGVDGLEPWKEKAFQGFAQEVFSWQFELCAPYRSFCERRGVTPSSVSDWREIPAVPTTAFKYFDLVSTPYTSISRKPDAAFYTSGTTLGSEQRGCHLVPRESLYRAAFHEPFRRALLPDVDKIRFISLIPSPVAASHSSLSWMVGMAADAFADEVDWLIQANGEWTKGAFDVLRAASEEVAPVLVLGTALAFLHLKEADDEPSVVLPPGSRAMVTGGFKGVRRAIGRSELYSTITDYTGIAWDRIVNEYGMTELLSQMYEPVLKEGTRAAGRLAAPPWLGVRVLDPATLEDQPEGEHGIISFFDLANLGSVSHVLTEDVGVLEEGRLTVFGRVPGSEPRGCSRAMDDLMAGGGRL
ncbi:MAG: hypothetical protein CME18_01720 [Gemmatimonadetes bacterium]|nr:hypothetical protein [Gemmatimonadota bacterium]|tara:strand:+ start:563 stop:1690 length:1128 start_codon:yes stop_codon:yes gene_type:complete